MSEQVRIEGRSTEKAVMLLASAQQAGLPLDVVRTTTNPPGYLVPEEVAKIYEEGPEDNPLEESQRSPYESSNTPPEGDDESTDDSDDKKPPRKATARKRAAKKEQKQ